MSVAKNLESINSIIGSGVKLVVVTKNRSIREINQAIFLGVKDIGENKVSEAKEKKMQIITKKVNWHMIGHLQRNKVKDAINIFDMIQSVDSLKLAKKIDFWCKLKNKVMSILVQVNIGREPQKYGIRPEDVFSFLKELSKLKNIKVLGFMATTPFIESEKVRHYFKELKMLFNQAKERKIPLIEMKYLSMGMTNDFEVAIKEGSNMVRIGTGVFKK
ncbi:MAG: YggS family pyridoxal phosphate-dependent enzyme [Nanoarchaeota archaeon]|nr:YggS family pyridoxal phosphate-dependent enzyme [Nanoarchaeota archaeon]MBU1030015.1 YggS family pyridoxal phosphate-dependent enzyme [Nanoarchaeota archaeon]MBU1850392.1 YggS family pyridoxal phosphate-dependent enzyme [Nanoarchaeota archaeon]